MENIEVVLDQVINENKDAVDQWMSNKPGSWGAIAGKAVIAARSQLGRSLTETEKRTVWQTLWNKLMKKRSEYTI